MVIIKSEPLDIDISITYRDILMLDTKANILESFEMLGMQVPKSLHKAELADMMATFFDEAPFYIINRLPEAEQRLLTRLVASKQTDYVEAPRNDEHFLALQNHHLVVTYPTATTWHLYMPDTIRHHIDKSAKQDLTLYPVVQEFNDTLDRLSHLQKDIERDIIRTPASLPIQEQPYYMQRLRNEQAELESIKTHLQKLEPQIDNIDFSSIYASIAVSYSQCDTKLKIMSMSSHRTTLTNF